jgi:hypothetical protein
VRWEREPPRGAVANRDFIFAFGHVVRASLQPRGQVLLMTGAGGITRRQAMRDTWLTYGDRTKSKVVYRFVIGTKGLNAATMAVLKVRGWQ